MNITTAINQLQKEADFYKNFIEVQPPTSLLGNCRYR